MIEDALIFTLQPEEFVAPTLLLVHFLPFQSYHILDSTFLREVIQTFVCQAHVDHFRRQFLKQSIAKLLKEITA